MNESIKIGRVDKKIKFKRVIWNGACALLFRPFPTFIFWQWRRLILLLFGAKIHPKAHVYSSVKIREPWNLQMERGACLGPNVICYNLAKIVLEEYAVVSQHSHLCTAGHQIDLNNNSNSTNIIISPIIIHKKAWIAASAFIGRGVEIGEYAIVGATASVFKDVESYTIVGGNPAKVIKKRIIGDEKS